MSCTILKCVLIHKVYCFTTDRTVYIAHYAVKVARPDFAELDVFGSTYIVDPGTTF